MIAIAFSVIAAVYLLIPNALYRFILGRYVPVRAFQGAKTEEITRAVATLLLLFALAVAVVWYVPICKDYPWPFPDTAQQRASDYSTVASAVYSETLFEKYGDNFWNALWRTSRRQGRFVCWYYTFVALLALWLGKLSKRYGELKGNKIYSWFADAYLLPHISQWHAILTGFTFPKGTIVRADVLMTDETLYSGQVAEYFLSSDGSLAGLFLGNPRRFDRTRYLNEREEWGTTRPVETFWRTIPSAKLYLIGSHIVNLNLNYEPPTAPSDVLQKYIEAFLKASYAPIKSPRITINALAPKSAKDTKA